MIAKMVFRKDIAITARRGWRNCGGKELPLISITLKKEVVTTMKAEEMEREAAELMRRGFH